MCLPSQTTRTSGGGQGYVLLALLRVHKMSTSTSSTAPADLQASSLLTSGDSIPTNTQQQQDSTPAPADQTTKTWNLRLPTIDCWNIFLATAAVVLTIIFGLPAWLSLYPSSDASRNLPIPQNGPDPVTAMICIQFYDHPVRIFVAKF